MLQHIFDTVSLHVSYTQPHWLRVKGGPLFLIMNDLKAACLVYWEWSRGSCAQTTAEVPQNPAGLKAIETLLQLAQCLGQTVLQFGGAVQ